MDSVKIKWLDIMTYNERMPLSEAKKALLSFSETDGTLIYEDNEKVVVAHYLADIPGAPEKIVCDYTAIPKGCIIGIVKR